MFDLTKDPTEQQNLWFGDAASRPAEVTAKFNELKTELTRLQKEYKDDGQYADRASWPKGSVDGMPQDKKSAGVKSVAEAMAAASAH